MVTSCRLCLLYDSLRWTEVGSGFGMCKFDGNYA